MPRSTHKDLRMDTGGTDAPEKPGDRARARSEEERESEGRRGKEDWPERGHQGTSASEPRDSVPEAGSKSKAVLPRPEPGARKKAGLGPAAPGGDGRRRREVWSGQGSCWPCPTPGRAAQGGDGPPSHEQWHARSPKRALPSRPGAEAQAKPGVTHGTSARTNNSPRRYAGANHPGQRSGVTAPGAVR